MEAEAGGEGWEGGEVWGEGDVRGEEGGEGGGEGEEGEDEVRELHFEGCEEDGLWTRM